MVERQQKCVKCDRLEVGSDDSRIEAEDIEHPVQPLPSASLHA
jgi:hypothetical protein